VIDIGLGLAPQAVTDGLLQPYKVATWDSIPATAKDADGNWYGD
jgi:putative spermidine/putrescine transport system substrate-binding protein